MALSRAERFRLKGRMLAEIDERDSGWDLRRQNLLLTEFGLPSLDGDWNNGPLFEDLIADIPDEFLIEMYGIVLGLEKQAVESLVEEPDSGGWKAGYVRLFISHSAIHKEFIGRVADELAVTGIHGFVAHDTVEFSRPWQTQIEQALRSMQALVAIVHNEFNASAWCHQEVGWALGRRVPTYVVRCGADPTGFVARDQWPSGYEVAPRTMANTIGSWVSTIPDLGERMVDGLFSALESANNYMDAGATASRIALLGHSQMISGGGSTRFSWQTTRSTAEPYRRRLCDPSTKSTTGLGHPLRHRRTPGRDSSKILPCGFRPRRRDASLDPRERAPRQPNDFSHAQPGNKTPRARSCPGEYGRKPTT